MRTTKCVMDEAEPGEPGEVGGKAPGHPDSRHRAIGLGIARPKPKVKIIHLQQLNLAERDPY